MKTKKILDSVCHYSSVAIAGMEKNTGKTEGLNFLVKNLYKRVKVGITSIGLDGETVDQITLTSKPEIFLYPGVVFATAEKFYKEKKFLSEVLWISDYKTNLGRLVIARALELGNCIIAGPHISSRLKKVLKKFKDFGVELSLVDGSLSRLSSSSPFITDAMILSTGAALSLDISLLIKKTCYKIELLQIPEYKDINKELIALKGALWKISKKEIVKLPGKTALKGLNESYDSLKNGDTLYISGALTDVFFNRLFQKKDISNFSIIVKDYTRIFCSQENYDKFISFGGKLFVLKGTKILGVLLNPLSPSGYKLDSDKLKMDLQSKLKIPVINVFEEEF